MRRKDTVGKLSWDLLVKDTQPVDFSPEEQMREQLEDWDKNIYYTVEEGKKVYQGDFFIVVETKKEPKMHNVLRNYFFFRQTCPTPTYDNTVYKYNYDDDNIEFLWVLPSKPIYQMIKDNFLKLTPDHKELIQFVLDDSDGTLLKICKKLNGEL